MLCLFDQQAQGARVCIVSYVSISRQTIIMVLYYIRWDQIRWNLMRWNQMRKIRWDKTISNDNGWDELRSDQIRSDQARWYGYKLGSRKDLRMPTRYSVVYFIVVSGSVLLPNSIDIDSVTSQSALSGVGSMYSQTTVSTVFTGIISSRWAA